MIIIHQIWGYGILRQCLKMPNILKGIVRYLNLPGQAEKIRGLRGRLAFLTVRVMNFQSDLDQPIGRPCRSCRSISGLPWFDPCCHGIGIEGPRAWMIGTRFHWVLEFVSRSSKENIQTLRIYTQDGIP